MNKHTTEENNQWQIQLILVRLITMYNLVPLNSEYQNRTIILNTKLMPKTLPSLIMLSLKHNSFINLRL